jgi:hypothetical protein
MEVILKAIKDNAPPSLLKEGESSVDISYKNLACQK